MSVWLLVQVAINLALILGIFTLWNKFRLNRNSEDPRLSKGLQLLQSKISVLEDLSDRSEVQVKQITALLNNKVKEAHDKIEEADRQIRAVEKSIAKSLEVAKIFQDKIPHQEIIERQATAKYIEAARLSNRGESVEEIAKKLDIPRGELEMISRMNQKEMVYREADIPAWAKTNTGPTEFFLETPEATETSAPANSDLEAIREQLRAQSHSFQQASPVAKPKPKIENNVISGSPSPASSRTLDTTTRTISNSASRFPTKNLSATSPKNAPAQTNARTETNARLEYNFATMVLEEETTTPTTKTSFSLKQSSIVEPGSKDIKPYEFKRIKVSKP